MAKPKKPSAAFEVEFKGSGVYPELIPLTTLSRALTAVQRLAAGREESAQEDENETAKTSEPPVGLLQVKRGSAVYQIATTAQMALQNLRETGDIIHDPETLGDREYILSPLDELSAVARSLGVCIVIKQPGRSGFVLATIHANSFAAVSEKLLVTGNTTLFGKVERVGGAVENKCGLRLPNRTHMLHCHVSTDATARLLGEKLYEEVAVHGQATWIKTTWRILAFKIYSVSQPRMGSAQDMLDALRNAGGSDWDKIDDPDAFLDGDVP